MGVAKAKELKEGMRICPETERKLHLPAEGVEVAIVALDEFNLEAFTARGAWAVRRWVSE